MIPGSNSSLNPAGKFLYFTSLKNYFISRNLIVRSKHFLLFFLLVSGMVLAQDGETVARLEGKLLFNPRVSPDGKTVAFTQEGYNGIYLMNENNGLTQLTDEPASGFGYSWLPDNSGIVARAAKFSGPIRENQVVIYTIADKGRTSISSLSSKSTILPGVSTGGDAYLLEGNTLLAFNPASKTTSTVTPRGTSAFIESDKIAVVTASGKKVIEPFKGQRCINAALSPDGGKVAFEIMGGNLFVINTDGTGLVDLGKGYRASWAPDSKTITYMITGDDGHKITASDIWLINPDGTGKKRVTGNSGNIELDPSFSSDGKYIYFADMNDASIRKVNVEGLR
ncbi:MAG: hypothetical protein HBSAPP04_06090 [Ignavibacteriaceae bacterium]|nr:MAG: hypothetical protein HBSAPP04_06090 [Ignavibacteriaceae bacterium]